MLPSSNRASTTASPRRQCTTSCAVWTLLRRNQECATTGEGAEDAPADHAEEADMSSPAIAASVGSYLRPFTDRRTRWVVATVVVLGPLLQLVEFALENPPDDNAARVATWVDEPGRIGISMGAGLLAIPFLLGGIGV